MNQSATIRLNGTEAPLTAATVADLLAQHEITADEKGVAVALNHAVLPRARWAEARLAPGDSVEIIRAKQGG